MKPHPLFRIFSFKNLGLKYAVKNTKIGNDFFGSKMPPPPSSFVPFPKETSVWQRGTSQSLWTQIVHKDIVNFGKCFNLL